MRKVKMSFTGLTVSEQIERAKLIHNKMSGNASFPSPQPALTAVQTAFDQLEIAYQESRGRDKNKVALLRLRRADLLNVIGLLAGYVQTASGGVEEVILSSGFDVVRRGVPQPPLGQVTNLQLKQGSNSGILHAAWDTLKGSRLYRIDLSSDPIAQDSFAPVGTSTKVSFNITNLVKGTNYWVRVAGLGKDGMGDFSDPATLLVT